jgi:cytochrome b
MTTYEETISTYEDAIGLQRQTLEAPEAREAAEAERQVWDLPVRIFHWTLVLAVVAAFVTNKLGVKFFKYHVWAGYAVIVLVGFRLIWGLVGTRHALFRNFVRAPSEILTYARDIRAGKDKPYAGHNPLGALMVLALLGALGAQAIFGLFGNDEIFNAGPLAGAVSKTLSLTLTSIHRQLFYWLAGGVALHVLAVAAHKIFKNENLARAMITGRKPAEAVPPQEAIHSSKIWLAVVLAETVVIALALILAQAPAAADLGDF